MVGGTSEVCPPIEVGSGDASTVVSRSSAIDVSEGNCAFRE